MSHFVVHVVFLVLFCVIVFVFLCLFDFVLRTFFAVALLQPSLYDGVDHVCCCVHSLCHIFVVSDFVVRSSHFSSRLIGYSFFQCISSAAHVFMVMLVVLPVFVLYTD